MKLLSRLILILSLGFFVSCEEEAELDAWFESYEWVEAESAKSFLDNSYQSLQMDHEKHLNQMAELTALIRLSDFLKISSLQIELPHFDLNNPIQSLKDMHKLDSQNDNVSTGISIPTGIYEWHQSENDFILSSQSTNTVLNYPTLDDDNNDQSVTIDNILVSDEPTDDNRDVVFKFSNSDVELHYLANWNIKRNGNYIPVRFELKVEDNSNVLFSIASGLPVPKIISFSFSNAEQIHNVRSSFYLFSEGKIGIGSVQALNSNDEKDILRWEFDYKGSLNSYEPNKMNLYFVIEDKWGSGILGKVIPNEEGAIVEFENGEKGHYQVAEDIWNHVGTWFEIND